MADVIIYEHANFQGRSQVLPKGKYDDALQQITIGNDALSSLKVPQGLAVRLYEHYHFQGQFIDITEDTEAITMFWNDKASSIVVYDKAAAPPITNEVMVFEHSNYEGKSQTLKAGRYDAGRGEILIGNDTLSSALVPPGLVLRLYEHANFQGRTVDIRGDTPAVDMPWNDLTSSILVYEAPIGLWKISNANAGVMGESTGYNGVRGISHAEGHGAVVGVNDNNTANAGPGVFGLSDGTGVWGQSKTWMGVYGNSQSTTGGAGVMGEAVGTGVIGTSKTWMGVYGNSQSTTGGAGVFGEGFGPTGIGIFGRGKRLAGYFEGDVEVTGDIRLLNADCAEDFNIGTHISVEPGTVMVLGEEDALLPSQHAYDKRVAGVVSGAGDYKPGIVLDKHKSERNRQPIALLGKVFCKVDAQYGAVEIGDLLTTSPTPGHAMKAEEPMKAFGAVIGKALRPLKEGQGLIPILIALQ